MTKWYIVIIGALCLVLGYLLRQCPDCGDARPGQRIDTITVEITTHDTVTVEKTRKEIVVKSEPVIRYVRTTDTVYPVQDSEVCYSFGEAMKDGAQVTSKLCSRAFPAQAPEDLHGAINYVPAPDTQRTIQITDTVMVKTTIWQKLKIAGIGALIGAIALIAIGR